LLERLDDPECNKTGKLDSCENVDPLERHLAQEHVVWLILEGHEHDEDAVEELQTFEGGGAHVKEHSEQNRHGDVAKNRGQRHGQTNHQKDHNVGDALLPDVLKRRIKLEKLSIFLFKRVLPDSQKLWLLARSCTLRLKFKRIDVVDGEDSCSHKPWQTHDRAYHDQDGQNKQI